MFFLIDIRNIFGYFIECVVHWVNAGILMLIVAGEGIKKIA